MADAELLARAKSLLNQLSEVPRFAGTPEEATARKTCGRELERAGFSCAEQAFDYSQWPGRWGPPVAAAFQAATIVAVARMAVHQGPLAALLTGAALMTALMLASGDAKRRWTTHFPFQRAQSVNLVARRGNPEVWLVAHIDSKSQTVPILIRIGSSVALGAVTLATLLVLLAAIGAGSVPEAVWHGLAIFAVAAALPSMFCLVRNDSPGAVDNASGVAAVLIASQMTASPNLGVLITSGEELGLAGAREWAARAGSGTLFINCDTVDDVGGWRCMYTGRKPLRITSAAEAVARRAGVKLAVGRLIPGILADSMAFADRGLDAVTISRGTLSTLARIHTRRDTSTTLAGGGIADAGALLSSLIKELG